MTGQSSPFVRVFYNQFEILAIDTFSYTYNEEEEDKCTFNINHLTESSPGEKYLQTKVPLIVIWGYIGGKTTKRLVFIQEIDWDFDEDGISCTITATDKSVTMRQSTSKDIHQKTNLVDLAKKIGDKHGLKVSVEQEAISPLVEMNPNLPLSQKILLNAAYAKEIQAVREERLYREKRTSIIPIDPAIQKNLTDYLNKYEARQKNPVIKANSQDIAWGRYKYHKIIPQGNKSDMQILKETAEQEAGGNYMIHSKDDGIIVKRRNFSQRSKKTYTWKSGSGELLSFKIQSNNMNKSGAANNLNYGGWDKDNKEYFNGNADAFNDNSKETLSKYEQQLADLKTKNKDDVVGVYYGLKVFGAKPGAMTGAADNTTTQLRLSLPITVLDKTKVLENTLKKFDSPTGLNKGIPDPLSTNPTDAFNRASNARNNAKLKKASNRIKTVGDPADQSGVVITIVGVSKKYSGNYYVKSCTHRIDSGGYITESEIIRGGHNVKENSYDVDYDETGKILNPELGPTDRVDNKVSLPIKRN